MSVLPPFVVSELCAQFDQIDPSLKVLFAMDEVPSLSGQQLEELMRGVWLAGYATALGEIADGPGPHPPLPPLAKWIDENML